MAQVTWGDATKDQCFRSHLVHLVHDIVGRISVIVWTPHQCAIVTVVVYPRLWEVLVESSLDRTMVGAIACWYGTKVFGVEVVGVTPLLSFPVLHGTSERRPALHFSFIAP